jgi:hypothetical protein
MRLRNWILAPLMAISVAALPARAADAAPTLVVRVKAIDGLIADAKYLAGLTGHSEQADQFEKMLPAFLGPKGLAGTGLDTARPWGLYATLDPQIPNSPVVVLIPVADENAFVASLNMFAGYVPGGNVTIAKGDDGVYTVSSPAAPVQAYFTIADRYAYITAMQKDSIAAGKRLSAAKLLPPDDRTVVGVALHLDTIDPQFKQIALGQFENQVAAVKEQKNKAETAVQTKLKSDVIDYVAGQVRSLMTDGQAVEFQLLLDRKTDDISAQLSLTAKPGSPLAKQIAAEGRQTSRFGPLNAAAVQGALKVAVPEPLRAALSEAIDEGFKQEQERQKDAMKKTLAQRIFGVLSPTLKAGELDIFAGFVGPNAEGKYTLAGGIKVKDSPKVEQLVRDLVPIIPDPKAKEAIAFDAETSGDVKVHKVTPYDLDAEGTRLFGTSATARVAFPTDAVVIAFGVDSANVLKQILGSAGKPGGPFRAEASIARVVGLNKGADQKQAKQAAAAAFAGKPHADLIQFTIDGGPALRVRASMKAQVVTFGAKMDEAAKGKTP